MFQQCCCIILEWNEEAACMDISENIIRYLSFNQAESDCIFEEDQKLTETVDTWEKAWDHYRVRYQLIKILGVYLYFL
jgi:hypothetical protein